VILAGDNMLFKNVLRTLKKQYIQLFLLGVIITLSSFIYSLFDYSIISVLEPTEAYFEEANQEEFAVEMFDFLLEEEITYAMSSCSVTDIPFTLSYLKSQDSACYYELQSRREEQLEDEYGFNLELREYKDIYFSYQGESYRYRAMKETFEINKSFYVVGNAPKNDNQIAMSEAHALANQFDIGDTITIHNKEYEISGFVLFSDYSLPMFGASITFDNQSQTLIALTDQEFERLSETVMFSYAGDYSDSVTEKSFKNDVIDHYRDNDEFVYVTNILLTVNNVRSGAIYGEIEGGQAMGLMLSLVIASIALLIVAIMVSKVLNSQRGPIGILKSMGYTNKEITMPYIVFIAMMSLPTIFLGYYLGFLASESMKDIFLQIYLLPSEAIEFNANTFIASVLLPFFFLLIISYFVIKRILGKKPVALLNPEVAKRNNFFSKFVGKYLRKLHITNKLKHLLLYRNTVKFVVFMVGMFYAAFLILLSLSFIGIFDRVLYDYYDSTEFEYIGYCDYVEPCELHGGEAVIELPSIQLDDGEVSAVGLEVDTKLHKLYNKKDDEITDDLEEGIIISKALVLTQGIKEGETYVLKLGNFEKEVTVSGVSNELSGNRFYMSREELATFLEQDTDYYNAVYSKQELHDEDFMLVISNDDVLKQSEKMQGFFNAMVWILIGVSSVIGAIVIYILTVLTIEDNFYNISLFKVIGYNDKEINKMILGGYMMYGLIAFILVIPFAILSFYGIQLVLAQYYDMIFPTQFYWWHPILSVSVFIVIFRIGAYIANKKLETISLQEAMKLYQV